MLNKSFKIIEKLITRQGYKVKIQYYRETLAHGELKSKVLKQERHSLPKAVEILIAFIIGR